jgi:hypothetical protein
MIHKCVVTYMDNIKKVTPLTGPILPVLSSVMPYDPESAYGAWIIQCDAIQVMVMVLLRGMCCPDPQYLAISVMEAKYTRLGYETRPSRLHTLDSPPPRLTLAFPRSSHSATTDSEQENNQETPDKLHVPQTDPPVTGLHNLN